MGVKGNIAIDGPAGAGKSTVAKLVAEELGYIYIDTGAMYRAITWKALFNKINLFDEDKLIKLATNTRIDFRFNFKTKDQFIYYDGKDITNEIRSPEVSKHVSDVAKVSGVRTILLKQQQLLAEGNNVVMDGRDIGSNVLPEAPFKFFLTASVEERAKRRFIELCNKGFKVTQLELIQDILKRDKADQERKIAPLVKVPEAIEIDTSYFSPEEVAERIIHIIRNNQKD